MAECILLRAGGGIDTDELTAERIHVLKDKIFYGRGSDEPQIGGMPDISFRTLPREGSTARVVNIDNFTIAGAGYCADVTFESAFIGYINATRFVHAIYGVHPDCVKYGQAIGANPAGGGFHTTGKFTGDANASKYDIRNGKTAYIKGEKVTGIMSEKQAATYTPSAADQKIWGGQYLIGDQTIKGDPNLIAANIKKGVRIFGVTGTWEGYVPTVNDLYLRGNQVIPWNKSSNAAFESDQINVPAEGWVETVNAVNLAEKKQLHVQYSASGTNTASTMIAIVDYGGSSISLGAHTAVVGENIAVFNLSNAQVNKKIRIQCRNIGSRHIKRIWLS